MLAFRAGDGSAFDALFHRWAGRVLRYLQRMVPDSGAAEELAQEVFVRVYRAGHRYEPQARFSTWLYTIATNLARNELRRGSRWAPAGDGGDDEGGVLGRAVVDASSAEERADARLRTRDLDRALAALPERQRSALWLSAVEGLSYREVAQALDTTEASVKTLVHRARAGLAARLDGNREGCSGGDESGGGTR